MSRFLLCTELGGGLGHVGQLRPIARRLVENGHQVAFALNDLVQADSMLTEFKQSMRLQSPVWHHLVDGLPSPQTACDVLLRNGYYSPQTLLPLVLGWIGLIHMYRPDVILGDFAPTAMLTGRLLGIPTASSGLSYYNPPSVQPIRGVPDDFLDIRNPNSAEQAKESDLAVMRSARSVETALRGNKVPSTLRGSYQMFTGDRQFLLTWPEFDHYKRSPDDELGGTRATWHGPSYSTPRNQTEYHFPQGASGPKVMAYLKKEHPKHKEILREMLRMHGINIILYMPEYVSDGIKPIDDPRIQYCRTPMNLIQVGAQASFAVMHAGESSVVQSLLAHCPVALVPLHREQELFTNRIVEQGLGIDLGKATTKHRSIASALYAFMNDEHIRIHTEVFAANHGDFSPEEESNLIADELIHMAVRQ